MLSSYCDAAKWYCYMSLEKKRKTTPSGVNSMRSQVLFWAAQGLYVFSWHLASHNRFRKFFLPTRRGLSDGFKAGVAVVQVGFGDVWKQSLSELSGGQRSLLALSLILAMLLFKPAPIYILDEVCARCLLLASSSPVSVGLMVASLVLCHGLCGTIVQPSSPWLGTL